MCLTLQHIGELLHEVLQDEFVTELERTLGEQVFDQRLARQIAGAIARLTEVELLLEENQVPIETRLFGPRQRPRLPESADANQSLPGDGTRTLPSEDAGLPNA